MDSPISTASLLDSFPMFGHPGISALEYAGRVEAKKRESDGFGELSLKRKSTNTSIDEMTAVGEADGASAEVDAATYLIEEFGSQRRRGTFINHTPRHYEMRPSKPVEVYRPSRADNENYSRPLSRQSSMLSSSPATQHCQHDAASPASFEQRFEIDRGFTSGPNSVQGETDRTPEVYVPSTNSTRGSASTPLGEIVPPAPQGASTSDQSPGADGMGSTSLSNLQPQEKKRQRRQTPFKITAEMISTRHEPLEPWVAQHRRKRTSDTIGDVPFDMDREVSAEIGTFGVIQRYFESQNGGPVMSIAALDSPPPVPSLPKHQETINEPIAIYPIEEMSEAPPVPDRSPKRLTAPGFPLQFGSPIDAEFNFASEDQYSPYNRSYGGEQICQKREAAEAGSSCLGRMAPVILSHHALTASVDLKKDEDNLAWFFKHTAPSSMSQPSAQQRKKKNMHLFKARQRKTLAARVGSVEGSPQRSRYQPSIPTCAQEMITSGGAKHLKIIIPTETPRGSQALSRPSIKSKKERRSRHISITFTEEMLNPLASPAVERIISSFDPPEQQQRSASAPLPRSPKEKSPKASPKRTPVTNHPLAPSRNESVRERKLRDLQRIKRKPIPQREGAPSAEHAQLQAALLTPAHTPEPENPVVSPFHEDSGIEEETQEDKMNSLQDKVDALQRQNELLTEALAQIVGLDIGDHRLGGEDLLKACRKMKEEV